MAQVNKGEAPVLRDLTPTGVANFCRELSDYLRPVHDQLFGRLQVGGSLDNTNINKTALAYTTDEVSETTNLYYTDSRGQASAQDFHNAITGNHSLLKQSAASADSSTSDSTVSVTSADASDLATVITLANEMKGDINTLVTDLNTIRTELESKLNDLKSVMRASGLLAT